MSIKGREVKIFLKEHGLEKGVPLVLQGLAEDYSIMKQQMGEMAQALEQLSQVVHELINIAEQHEGLAEKIKNRWGDHLLDS